MLQRRLQAMLCTVCLHAHGIMQDPFIGFLLHVFGLSVKWFTSLMDVSLGFVLHKARIFFLFCGLA